MNKCARCGEVNPAEIHTCSPQTRAQRLAERHEHFARATGGIKSAFVGKDMLMETASELRRLDALNAELVGALEFVIRGVPDTWDGVQKAREVIAKAKENING